MTLEKFYRFLHAWAEEKIHSCQTSDQKCEKCRKWYSVHGIKSKEATADPLVDKIECSNCGYITEWYMGAMLPIWLSAVRGIEMTKTAEELAERSWVCASRSLEEYVKEVTPHFQEALLEAEKRGREKSYWPKFDVKPRHANPAKGWEDPALPDFELIWKIGRENGYAIGLHGSMQRDCDLIAVPWIERPSIPSVLVDALCEALNATMIGTAEAKPFGRIAVNLQIDGWYKLIDLSIIDQMPTINLQTKASLLDDVLNPRRWTKEMKDAWDQQLPHINSAFAALRAVVKGMI